MSPADDGRAPSDPQWYRDAIIYQLHLKSFFDANDDGVGDFEGLLRKLDHIVSLGVTALSMTWSHSWIESVGRRWARVPTSSMMRSTAGAAWTYASA